MIYRYGQFSFFRQDLGIVSPPHFLYVSRKILLVLYSTNWRNFWLPLLLELLDSVCIIIVCFPRCDVINFEIKLILLIKQFFYLTKTSRQNLNILRTKRASKGEIKRFFHHFWRAFRCQKLSLILECTFTKHASFVMLKYTSWGPFPWSFVSKMYHDGNSKRVLEIKREIQKNRNNTLEVFLGKSVLKIRSKFAGEHPCRSVISIN